MKQIKFSFSTLDILDNKCVGYDSRVHKLIESYDKNINFKNFYISSVFPVLIYNKVNLSLSNNGNWSYYE